MRHIHPCFGRDFPADAPLATLALDGLGVWAPLRRAAERYTGAPRRLGCDVHNREMPQRSTIRRDKTPAPQAQRRSCTDGYCARAQTQRGSIQAFRPVHHGLHQGRSHEGVRSPPDRESTSWRLRAPECTLRRRRRTDLVWRLDMRVVVQSPRHHRLGGRCSGSRCGGRSPGHRRRGPA